MTHREDGSLPLRWKLILAVLPLGAALIALGIGRIFIAPGDVAAALASRFDPGTEVADLVKMTIWNLRMPRILLAALVGAGLSVAGCAFQSLFANPLATPDTLGVASGASFGAALAILMGFKMIGIQAV
jgi:iron complex transport system permease protein